MGEIKMHGMKGFIQQEFRISLQIMECGPAGPKSENRKLATFLPIFVIGKVAKLKRDEEGILARNGARHGMRGVIRAYFREANDILAQGTRHKRSRSFAMKAVCQPPSIGAVFRHSTASAVAKKTVECGFWSLYCT